MSDARAPAPTQDTHNIQSNGAPLFPLGVVVATPGALALLQKHGVNAVTLLRRHQRGDWGDLSAHDCAANHRAVKDGSRILSAYVVAGEKVWVITEAVAGKGLGRPFTCTLLPKEY